MQRLFDALINAAKKHPNKIAGITLLILQILKTDTHEIILIPIEKTLLHQRVKLFMFSTQTKLRLLINFFVSKNYPNEKLKDLLIFLVKSFAGMNYSEDMQLFNISRIIDRRSLLTIEIFQKETPRFIYHAFFASLRQLYYSTPLMRDAEKIMCDYLEKYLREINIVALLEFQNDFRGALHKLLENKKGVLQFI